MQIINLQKDKLHLTKVTFSDGGEVLLDNDICSQECFTVGNDISEEELKNFIFDSDYSRAKSRAVWYLDRKDYTEKALYDKLLKAGFSKKASSKVIARFIEVGLINDERYASNYAERLMNANVSKREAIQKMLLKGVPYDLTKSVLDEVEFDEQSQLKNLIEKKYRSKLLLENGTEKVYAALVRKGFSYGEVKEALKSYIEESEEDYV